jgi:hypothetical protein
MLCGLSFICKQSSLQLTGLKDFTNVLLLMLCYHICKSSQYAFGFGDVLDTELRFIYYQQLLGLSFQLQLAKSVAPVG